MCIDLCGRSAVLVSLQALKPALRETHIHMWYRHTCKVLRVRGIGKSREREGWQNKAQRNLEWDPTHASSTLCTLQHNSRPVATQRTQLRETYCTYTKRATAQMLDVGPTMTPSVCTLIPLLCPVVPLHVRLINAVWKKSPNSSLSSAVDSPACWTGTAKTGRMREWRRAGGNRGRNKIPQSLRASLWRERPGNKERGIRYDIYLYLRSEQERFKAVVQTKVRREQYAA